MRKIYIIEDLLDNCSEHMSLSRTMYYVGYVFGLLRRAAMGAAIAFAIRFAYTFIRLCLGG